MNKFSALLSISIISMVLTSCANYVGPDESGRLCAPLSIMAGSDGCIAGCDIDASALYCTADGRAWECRIHDGRVCRTDPGCPGGGVDCVIGVGACLRHGLTSCPAGSSVASLCSAVPGSPVAEICRDAIDNDCNGVADDGCPTCIPSGVEICDNLDNDCDGAIDDGCDDDDDDHCDGTMQMGPSGSLHCPRTPPGRSTGDDCDDSVSTGSLRHPGAAEICGNGIDEDCNGSDLACPPTCVAEVCNGRDDDCDGAIDNGVRNACGTCGAVPTEVCGNGIDEDCNGYDLVCPPVCVAEICNFRDDDCDGLVDEGGVCGPVCTPTTEVCDNIDNDCDGTRDEGVVTDCYTGPASTRYVGACRGGWATCSAGSFGSCVGQILPTTEICGNSIDEDCNGVLNNGCPATCTYRGAEICGNGIDEDCVGGDLACTPACGGAAVGTEICVSYGPDMPPLATYGLATVIDADITIFGCDGVPRTFRIDSVTRQACIPISSTCTGWLATTYSEGSFADLNNIGSWYAPDGTNYRGMNASDSRLSGTLTSVSNIRVWARRPGLSDRELTDRSWIASDPSGYTIPSYSRSHIGERATRLMVPVREECTVSTARPPDRY